MPEQPSTTRRVPPGSRLRPVVIVLAGAAVLAIAFALYAALSPGGKRTPSQHPAGPAASGAAVTAQTMQGTRVRVPDGARPSVLFFFSATCGNCGPSARAVGQAQQAAGPKAVFVAVDIDPSDSEQAIKDFLIANQAGGVAFTRDARAALMSSYQVTQPSTVVVLDGAGAVMFRAVEPTADQIGAQLAKLGA
ncbi:alkyl hydroperoxide reductase [Mycobacterium sp. SM1]|uniref:TlpA family protein disulfide reductase n=1 Tax=Mycobacterium sp. SM1 TaxID=2816243 RepID=UPI001BCDA041|nr:thioredoxin-like domain-containing protein [Mycobacterium sp. SM1]MBS4728662.1 alkyl hydroperoxide reductase [Mycobacterium sp. SM1]